MTKRTKTILAAVCGTAVVVASILEGYTPEEVGTLLRAIVACLVGVI